MGAKKVLRTIVAVLSGELCPDVHVLTCFESGGGLLRLKGCAVEQIKSIESSRMLQLNRFNFFTTSSDKRAQERSLRLM